MSTVSPRAGRRAEPGDLVDVDALLHAYRDAPDPEEAAQRVAFGTSGHRGSSLRRSFNEAHVLAVTQAVCDHRRAAGIAGPLHLGADTHALSAPALETALEVLAGNGVEVLVAPEGMPTATPLVSHAILAHRHAHGPGQSDGIVVSPSHNPPEDGGIKYNPPHGGPAGTAVTRWVEDRANALLAAGLDGVRRRAPRGAGSVRVHDYVGAYVADLEAAVDVDAIRHASIRIGVDPLGGAAVAVWPAVADRLGLDIEIVDATVDPTFGFMTLDWDGRIRMDCSSPYAMARLVGMRERFDIALANDADADRHGVVTRAGLMSPNHVLAVAVDHLLRARRRWPDGVAVGRTVVTTALLDRIAASLGRPLLEVPVGFKWFVDGLLDGSVGFGGEESAGASLLRRDGTVWTTDKDGIAMCLVAVEAAALAGRDLAEVYLGLAARHGAPSYRRVDAPATPEERRRLGALDASAVDAVALAGDPITAVLTTAPGNGAPIGGLKVASANCWFAARPSGTEAVYKVYAESFLGDDHLARVVDEAQAVVDAALR